MEKQYCKMSRKSGTLFFRFVNRAREGGLYHGNTLFKSFQVVCLDGHVKKMSEKCVTTTGPLLRVTCLVRQRRLRGALFAGWKGGIQICSLSVTTPDTSSRLISAPPCPLERRLLWLKKGNGASETVNRPCVDLDALLGAEIRRIPTCKKYFH